MWHRVIATTQQPSLAPPPPRISRDPIIDDSMLPVVTVSAIKDENVNGNRIDKPSKDGELNWEPIVTEPPDLPRMPSLNPNV